ARAFDELLGALCFVALTTRALRISLRNQLRKLLRREQGSLGPLRALLQGIEVRRNLPLGIGQARHLLAPPRVLARLERALNQPEGRLDRFRIGLVHLDQPALRSLHFAVAKLHLAALTAKNAR